MWPTVVIPPDLDESLTPKQLTWVLLHELAHIRRGDLWVVVVQRLVQAVFFFNPAVHLANWLATLRAPVKPSNFRREP